MRTPIILILINFLFKLIIIFVSRIVSPICLRTCFIEAISIPENNSPVYTMAMRNIVLSISNLSPKEKVNQSSPHIFYLLSY